MHFANDQIVQEGESNMKQIGEILKGNNKFDKNTSNLSTTETDNNFLRSYLKSSFEFVNVFARFLKQDRLTIMRDFDMTVSTHQKLGETFNILAKPFTPYHLIHFPNLNFALPPPNFFLFNLKR